MKDPAFLFYPGDWMGGTHWMTFEQKGCYMELLILQFNAGKFTELQAKQVLSICFEVAWATLKQKFFFDGEYYYNERLKSEIDKRSKFTESRRINGLTPKKSNKHMLKHMEDENRDENKVVILNKTMVCFENFRKEYKGKKNGLEVEYKNFIKKNDPKQAELLLPALYDEIEYRQNLEAAGAFVAEWKNLSTWINQKCWLQEFPEIKINQNGKSKIRSVASRSAEIDAIIDAVWDAKGLK